MIDDINAKVQTAAAAVSGGVWSLEHGVSYCSDYGDIQDEIEQIKEEQAGKDALAQQEPKVKET